MSLWQRYRRLTPHTRLLLGGAAIAWASLGLLASDAAEQAFGFAPSPAEQQRVWEAVPRVRVVERRSASEGVGAEGQQQRQQGAE